MSAKTKEAFTLFCHLRALLRALVSWVLNHLLIRISCFRRSVIGRSFENIRRVWTYLRVRGVIGHRRLLISNDGIVASTSFTLLLSNPMLVKNPWSVYSLCIVWNRNSFRVLFTRKQYVAQHDFNKTNIKSSDSVCFWASCILKGNTNTTSIKKTRSRKETLNKGNIGKWGEGCVILLWPLYPFLSEFPAENDLKTWKKFTSTSGTETLCSSLFYIFHFEKQCQCGKRFEVRLCALPRTQFQHQKWKLHQSGCPALDHYITGRGWSSTCIL